jgi:hypothetical protein
VTQENDNRPNTARDEEQRLTTRELAGAGRADGGNEDQVRRAPSSDDQQTPLFPPEEANELRQRWDGVQASFVDEPRRAVEEADSLVAGAMKRLAETFAAERATLEAQWDRGDHVSTEDLRIALQRYRSFFSRLLSM